MAQVTTSSLLAKRGEKETDVAELLRQIIAAKVPPATHAAPAFAKIPRLEDGREVANT
jgi:hypothetical protein